MHALQFTPAWTSRAEFMDRVKTGTLITAGGSAGSARGAFRLLEEHPLNVLWLACRPRVLCDAPCRPARLRFVDRTSGRNVLVSGELCRVDDRNLLIDLWDRGAEGESTTEVPPPDLELMKLSVQSVRECATVNASRNHSLQNASRRDAEKGRWKGASTTQQLFKHNAERR